MDFLPPIPALKRVSQAIAMLDLIVEPDEVARYFSYQPSWRPGEALASMSNGSGDEYWIVFAADGVAYVQGFDHESKLSSWGNEDRELPAGIVDGLPDRFQQYLSEPAFSFEGIPSLTVCLWSQAGASATWEHGSVPPPGSPDDQSGAARLFEVVSRLDPGAYVEFAEDYYEIEIDADAVAEVYQQRPLDQALVSRINPDRVLADLLPELRQIGYPVAE